METVDASKIKWQKIKVADPDGNAVVFSDINTDSLSKEHEIIDVHYDLDNEIIEIRISGVMDGVEEIDDYDTYTKKIKEQ